MSGSDSIVINTRERAASGDINDLQSLKDRTFLDALKHMLSRRTFASAAVPTEAPRNVVLGGLLVTPSGADVAISAGVVLQNSAALAPVPGALDSTYRIAINKAPVLETPPVPGSETWYLLEAQMSEVVALATTRDVFDTGTGTFIPTAVDKRKERVPTFQFVAGAGGQAPAPSGGDWVPIALVRRPAGGGAVVASDIYDCRPMWDELTQERDAWEFNDLGILRRQVRTETLLNDSGAWSTSVNVQAEVIVDGQRLWIDTGTPADLSSAKYRPASVSIIAGGTYYLYLASWQGLGVVDPTRTAVAGKGVLVLSDVAPVGQGNNRNSAALDLPAPWNVTQAPANTAVCLAVFRAGDPGGGLGFRYLEIIGNEAHLGEETGVTFSGGSAPSTDPTYDFATDPDVPPTAKAVRCSIKVTPDGGAGNTQGSLSIKPAPGGAAFQPFRSFRWSEDSWDTFEFVVPLRGTTDWQFEFSGTTPPVTATVIILGWIE